MPLKSNPHVLRSEMRKLRNEAPSELFNLCDELRATPGDIVFLCQDGKPVECNSEILIMVSPMIRRIIKGTLMNSYLLPKDFKIYMSVEFNSKVMLTLLDMIYHQKSKVIANDHIEEFRSLAASLDINDSNFVKAEQTPEVEDDAIVDVINDLMDEYNVNPNQTQNELEEMLLTTLDESFINDTLGASTSLESLLVEPLDIDNLCKEEKVVEEVSDKIEETKSKTNDKVKSGPKRRKMKPTKHRLRDCGVEIENLSNQTLSYYCDILKSKKEKTAEESVLNPDVIEAQDDSKETNAESPKRKRKAKSFPDFEMDPVKKVSKTGLSKMSAPVFNETSNDSSIKDQASDLKIVESSLQEESLTKPKPDDKTAQSPSEELSGETFNTLKALDADLQVINVKKIKCLYCEESYGTRSKILQHLSVSHFQSQILAKYPFVRGECVLCVELGRPKPICAKNKQVHLLHVGSLHEKVIEYIPEAFKSNIDQEFPMRKRSVKIKIKDEPLDDSNISNVSSSIDDSNTSSLMDISNNHSDVSSSFEVSFQDSFAKSLLSSNIVESSPSLSPVKTNMFLPQQNEDANHAPSSPAPSVSSGSSQEAKGLLSCSLCPVTDMVFFQYKSQMLSHLSLVHLSTELLTLFPRPQDGDCQICLELNKCFESKPVENFSEDEGYIEHVGSHHERVLEILPTDICDKINSLQSEAPVVVIQEDSGHGSKDASILDVSFESSLNSTAICEDSNSGDISQSSVLDDSSLARFVELSQKVTTEEPSSASAPMMAVLKCKHCPEIFTSAEERLIHIRNVHTSIRRKVYNCRYCDAAFKDPKQFKLHLLAHKKDLVQQ